MNRIKELRKQQGLTLDAMAEKVQINRATLNRYENGNSEPKLDTWQKLADYFGVDVGYLQGVSDTPHSITVFDHPISETLAPYKNSFTHNELLAMENDILNTLNKADDVANLSDTDKMTIGELISIQNVAGSDGQRGETTKKALKTLISVLHEKYLSSFAYESETENEIIESINNALIKLATDLNGINK